MPEDEPDSGTSRVGSLKTSASARVEQAKQTGVEAIERLEHRWPYTAMLRELPLRFRRLNGTVLAGHLAFRMFLVMLPTFVLVVGVAGFAKSSGVDVHSLATEQVDMSTALSATVQQGLDEAEQGRFALAVSGTFGLVLAALGMFSALYYGFAQAWGVPVGKMTRRWSMFLRFIGALVAFLVVWLLTATLRKRGFYLSAMGSGIAVLTFTLALLGLSWVMPRRATSWAWLLPGALVSAVGYLMLQLVVVVYLPDKLARSSQLYGSLGVAVALLFLLLLIADIVILSAFVNAVWWDHFHPDGDDRDDEAARQYEEFVGGVVDRAASLRRRARRKVGDPPGPSAAGGGEVAPERPVSG